MYVDTEEYKMNFYRIKQLFWHLNDRVTADDRRFINNILSKKEIELFNKLTISEQKHCIKVAYEVKEKCDNDSKLDRENLIKAALLHDIGKINYNMNIISKCILVIMDKITNGKLKKFYKIKAIQSYYNHGEKGYKILKANGCSEKVLFLVKSHHKENIYNDKELNILKMCDGKH